MRSRPDDPDFPFDYTVLFTNRQKNFLERQTRELEKSVGAVIRELVIKDMSCYKEEYYADNSRT